MTKYLMGSRQPIIKVPRKMPDGKRIKTHPFLHLMNKCLPEGKSKADVAAFLRVRPQSIYKWERCCEVNEHFPLPAPRAAKLAEFFNVPASLLRPDVFKEAA